MELFRERVCGIDIGKADVKACVRVPGKGTRRVEVTRTFSTTTNGLLLLRDWLAGQRVELVGMVIDGTGLIAFPETTKPSPPASIQRAVPCTCVLLFRAGHVDSLSVAKLSRDRAVSAGQTVCSVSMFA